MATRAATPAPSAEASEGPHLAQLRLVSWPGPPGNQVLQQYRVEQADGEHESGADDVGVEEIAESAGFSTGAVYSNFGGKEELVVELLANRAMGQIAGAVRTVVDAHAGIEEPMRALSRPLTTAADEDSEFVLLQVELWLYAMRNPALRETLARRMREPHDAMQTACSSHSWSESAGGTRCPRT